MLRIVNLENLQSLLLRIPILVDKLERRDSGFPEAVSTWLKNLEQALTNNRLPVASRIAALRGLLTLADRGGFPQGLEIRGRASGRKVRLASAVEALRQADQAMTEALASDAARIADAHRMGRQLVALAKAKGLISSHVAPTDPLEFLKRIRSDLASDEQTAGGIVNLEGLVGPQDSLMVLDRAITADVWSDSKSPGVEG